MTAVDRISLAFSVCRRLAVHESATLGISLLPIARFAAWQVRKRLSDKPTDVSAFGSGRLRCYPDAHATNAVLYHGWPDWNEMRLLALALRPGDGFVDAGANVGVYSVLASTRVMPGGRVIAVEPEPSVAARLRENFRLNGLITDDVHEVALGAAPGTLRFELGRDCTGRIVPPEASGGVEVPVRTLDAVIGDDDLDRLAFGKLDVEGFELQALRGAARLLAARRPRGWILETNARCVEYGTTRRELHELLQSHGYMLAAVEHGGSRLRRLPLGGPYPQNSLAISDLGWLRSRVPHLEVV